MASRPQLGPFAVHAVVGQGGMGTVYRGMHVEQCVEVAIKVIAPRYAADAMHRAAFGREVRAVAGLDHPGIVRVFDHGLIPAEAAFASGGVLSEGSPYLVMEWIGQGSLSKQRPTSWAMMRRVLVELLDVLAHAHARGVVHRDLKPSNVMRAPAGSPTVIKLTDFGIAHFIDDEGAVSEGQTGTPQYMAPEQVQGHMLEYGPWTDLYAFGCLAYRLATGFPPFFEEGVSQTEILRRQLHETVPELESRLPLPDGFSGWLEDLLHKNRRGRFQRAADAMAALSNLGEPRGEWVAQIHPALTEAERGSRESQTLSEESPTSTATHLALSEDGAAAEPDISLPRRASIRPPSARVPWPADWRRDLPPVSVSLRGAGLGLYGLRPIPMINRDAERDHLWNALGRVRESGAPETIVLEGGAGVGKSRLARWLATRAHEAGGATLLKASHQLRPGPMDGLGPMLARALRTQNMGLDSAIERTLHVVDLWGGRVEDALAMVDLTHPASRPVLGEDSARPRMLGPSERRLALRRALALLTLDRPVIVWLDDAQWGLEALEFVAYLSALRARVPLPVLFVLTVRGGALTPGLVQEQALKDLVNDGATKLEVAPLSRPHQMRLVSTLLGLAGELAEEVTERTAGNPLFAIRLVGDWVQDGLLVPGKTGFRLKAGANIHLPEDIHQAWNQALASLESSLGPAALLAVEVAATLGMSVDRREWRRACSIAELSDVEAVPEALERRGLAQTSEAGFSFNHGMFVDSLLQAAQEQGRRRGHESACARAIADAVTAGVQGASLRMAGHLEASGDLAGATSAWLNAAEEATERSRFVDALALLARRSRLLDRQKVPEHDLRRAQGWLHEALTLAKQGHPVRSLRLVEKAQKVASAEGQQVLLAAALHGRGKSYQMQGQVAPAIEAFEAARDRYLELDDPGGMARCEHGIAEMLKQSARRADSIPLYERALLHYEEAGEHGLRANCLLGFADVLRDRDLPRALRLLTAARAVQQARGNPLGLAIVILYHGILARDEGDLELAEAKFRESGQIFREIESTDAMVVDTHLGILEVMRADFARGADIFEAALREAKAAGRRGYLAYLYVGLIPCRAALGEWEAFDEACTNAENVLAESGLVDEEIEWLARLGATRAQSEGHETRGERARAIADRQHDKIAERAG